MNTRLGGLACKRPRRVSPGQAQAAGCNRASSTAATSTARYHKRCETRKPRLDRPDGSVVMWHALFLSLRSRRGLALASITRTLPTATHRTMDELQIRGKDRANLKPPATRWKFRHGLAPDLQSISTIKSGSSPGRTGTHSYQNRSASKLAAGSAVDCETMASMHYFWPSSGFGELERNERGWLLPTDDYLRLFLARPELALVPESARPNWPCTARWWIPLQGR